MKALINGVLTEVADPTVEQMSIGEAAAANRVVPAKPIGGVKFLQRLTPEEYAAILNAARTMLINAQPQLSIWIDTLRLKGFIVVTDQAAIDAKAFLIAQSLLTQERADIIFAKG